MADRERKGADFQHSLNPVWPLQTGSEKRICLAEPVIRFGYGGSVPRVERRVAARGSGHLLQRDEGLVLAISRSLSAL